MEDQREALEDGALAVFRVVELQAPMRVDQLHALPEIIRSSVRLRIHRGAAAALEPMRHAGCRGEVRLYRLVSRGVASLGNRRRVMMMMAYL